MKTNEELLALAQDQELEGEETTQVVQAVSDKFGQISDELASALAKVDELTAGQLSDADREALASKLTNAKALSDNSQAVLQALLAPVE